MGFFLKTVFILKKRFSSMVNMRCVRTRSPIADRAVCVCDVCRLCSYLAMVRSQPTDVVGWKDREAAG